MNSVKALGLMSGTSLDGVDVALIETDGIRLDAIGPCGYRPYSDDEREILRQALAAAASLSDRTARPGIIAHAETIVTAAHGEAVEQFLDAHRLAPADIDVIGFHGQTVLHRPAAGLTVQIGDGEALARRLRIATAYDFRAADVAAGGQGAPLVPVYHRALASTLDRVAPLAVVNIGGVANVSYIDGDAELIAFDTGPGNALLDDFVRARTGASRDHDGAHAARGVVDRAVLAAALAHPYFSAPAPKSLDRNDFAALDLDHLSLADGAATLVALTAETVALARDFLPDAPRTWIVSGGGARNPTLMATLARKLAPAEVVAAERVGWAGDAVEAQAFAYLAARVLASEPITFPGTTGVPRPMTGGIVVRP